MNKISKYVTDVPVSFRLTERNSNTEDDYFALTVSDAANGDQIMEIKISAQDLAFAVMGMRSAAGTANILLAPDQLGKKIVAVTLRGEQFGVPRFSDKEFEKIEARATTLRAAFAADDMWIQNTNAGPRAVFRWYVQDGSDEHATVLAVAKTLEEAEDVRPLMKNDKE